MILTDLLRKREDADSLASVYAFDCGVLFGEKRNNNWTGRAAAAFTHVRDKGYNAAVLYNVSRFTDQEIDLLIKAAKRSGFGHIKIEIRVHEVPAGSRLVERLDALDIEELCFALQNFQREAGLKLIKELAGSAQPDKRRIKLAAKYETAEDINEIEQTVRRISKLGIERIVLIPPGEEKKHLELGFSLKKISGSLSSELDVTIEIQRGETADVFRGFSARKKEAEELLLDVPYFYLAEKPVALGAVFQLGFGCGQNCVFCTSDRSFPEPDDALVSSVLDDVLKLGAPRVVFTGGEPTMNKGLASFIGKCANAGVGEISVYTNGMAFSSKIFTGTLAEAGLNLALVSLHADDERISDSITRKKGGFKNTVAGIENLLDAGMFTIINCVICSGNYAVLERHVEFIAKKFPGAVLNLSYVAPIAEHTARPEIVPRFSDAAPHIKAALDACDAMGVPVSGLEPHWGIPPCALAADERYFAALPSVQESLSGFVKSPDCRRCALNSCCPGVRKHYTELYGLEEIIPLM